MILLLIWLGSAIASLLLYWLVFTLSDNPNKYPITVRDLGSLLFIMLSGPFGLATALIMIIVALVVCLTYDIGETFHKTKAKFDAFLDKPLINK